MNTLLNKKKEPIDKLAAASGRSIGGEAFRRMLRSPVAITGGVITGLFFLLVHARQFEGVEPNPTATALAHIQGETSDLPLNQLIEASWAFHKSRLP